MDRIALLLTTCLVLVILYIVNQYLSQRQYLAKPHTEHYETFQEQRKDENLCLKPFSVTNNKERTFHALIALEERIDELEYSLRKSGQKYDPMYKWYKLKVETDSKEAKESVDALKSEMKGALDRQAQQAKEEYIRKQKEEQDIDVLMGTGDTPESKPVKEALKTSYQKGDPKEQEQLAKQMKEVGPPEGYW